MRDYEILYIVRPDLDEAQLNEAVGSVTGAYALQMGYTGVACSYTGDTAGVPVIAANAENETRTNENNQSPNHRDDPPTQQSRNHHLDLSCLEINTPPT